VRIERFGTFSQERKQRGQTYTLTKSKSGVGPRYVIDKYEIVSKNRSIFGLKRLLLGVKQAV